MNSFAVIFTYSFDDEVVVYLFDNESDAKKFLFDSYREEMRVDTEENGWNAEGWISEDGRYARITTRFDNGEDTTEFRLGNVYR